MVLALAADSSEVLFSLDVGTERLVLLVRSMAPLNDGQWHRIDAERNIKEVVLHLDGRFRESRTTPPQGHSRVELHSNLYVGRNRSCCRNTQSREPHLTVRDTVHSSCLQCVKQNPVFTYIVGNFNLINILRLY